MAAAGFLAVVLLAREGHAAHSGSSSGGSSSTIPTTGEDDFSFDSGSVSPSTATPDVQSSTS